MTTDRRIVIGVSLLAAAALFFGGWQCHSNKVKKSTGTVVTVTKDSLIYVDKPVPYKVDSLVYVKGKDGKSYPVYVHDTTPGTYEVRIDPADTMAILKRFYDVAYYKREVDSGRFKITVLDTVSQNRIQGGSIRATSLDTNTTTTIIKTLPRNFVGYWTIAGGWSPPSLLPRYGGLGAALKFPGDMVIQAELGAVKVPESVNKRGVIALVQGRVYVPIRKRKK